MSAATSARSTVRRNPRRARYDQDSVYRVLDRGRAAHVSFCADGQPYCIPTLYARAADELLIHGSSASRMLRLLASGAPACVTVTILDGLVLARSAFEHSANYDSVMLLERFRARSTDEQKLEALQAFMEIQLPGRWSEVRAPTGQELKATAALAPPICEASVKTCSGPPDNDGSRDAARDVWAGVIPIVTGYGQPQPSPDLRPGTSTPPSVDQLSAPASTVCDLLKIVAAGVAMPDGSAVTKTPPSCERRRSPGKQGESHDR